MIRGFAALLLIIFAILSLLHSCANIKPPVGGPRDTIPPLIIETVPLAQSLNFKGEVVRVKFHEPIKVDNLNKKLIITPRFEEFEYKSTKYEVIVSLLEPLADSTTYTFNFTDGVRDLNENNIALDVSVAFSTTNFIDSVTLVGKAINLFSNEIIAESVVALYGLEDTLDLFTGKPMYYARANEKGIFKFQNLRNEPYQLYAYTDLNNDLVADSRKEVYGFQAEPVNQVPQQVGDTLIVALSPLNVTDLELISSRPYQHYYDIKMVKTIVDFKLTLLDSAKLMDQTIPEAHVDYGHDSTARQEEILGADPIERSYIWDHKDINLYGNYLPGQDLIRIFQTFPVADSLAFRFWAKDSVGFEIDTTLYLQFRESNRPPLPFVTNFDPPDNDAVDLTFKGTYRFTKPITQADYDSILLEYDSINVLHFTPETELIWNPSRTELILNKLIDEALIERLIQEKEEAEVTRSRMKELEKVRLDSLKQVETDSLRQVMESMGLSHTAAIDSLKAIRQSADSGQIALDSIVRANLNHDLDSLVNLDRKQLKKLRPKPPESKPVLDSAVLDTLSMDTLALDSTLVMEDSTLTKGRKRKRKGFKLNLPKKKDKPIITQVEEETKKPIPSGGFRISIPKGSFISVEGDTSGSVNRIYRIKDPAKLGLIKGQVQTQETKFTVQLLNKYYEVVLQQADQKAYEFANIAPGDYYIRILVDQNQNGQWDPGNVHQLIEPEPVIFYPHSIPVKENWELENELIRF